MNKEVIEYSVFEIGIEETIKIYGLTQNKFDKIMFGEKCGTPPKIEYLEPKQEKIIEIPIGEDYRQLCRVINDNYQLLQSKLCINTFVLDVRAQNVEDKFHNTLIKIMTTGNFKYTNDAETIRYITRSFKRLKLDDYKSNKVLQKNLIKLKETIQMEATPTIDVSAILEDSGFIEVLTEKEKKVFKLIGQGLSITEISYKLKNNKGTTSNEVANIANKLKVFAINSPNYNSKKDTINIFQLNRNVG